MRLLMSAFGSYGDVLPMIGIGQAMRRRGVRVQVIVNPYFEQVLEHAGLEMLPLGSAEEYRSLMQHPDLWHPRRGLKLVLTRGLVGYLRAAWEHVIANYRPGETVIAAHGLDMASRVFHDKCGAPLATVHLAPFAIKSLIDTPRYIGAPTVHVGPRWFRGAQFWLADRLIVDPAIAPAINALRVEQGLSPVKAIFAGWNNSPDMVLAMFPEWFAAPAPDWPPNVYQPGFPLWDPRPEDGLPADVKDFLQAGSPPIGFAAGSANQQGHEFFETATEVCRRLRRRGLLLTKYPEQLPKNLPPDIRHAGFVPFSLLLPRLAALVHHGGIGTCGQGLASGRPQLVMPMAYDQLDNGKRLERLEVGAVVPRRQFKPAQVVSALAPLLDSNAVSNRCRELATKCDGAAALELACDRLEELYERTKSRRMKSAVASSH